MAKKDNIESLAEYALEKRVDEIVDNRVKLWGIKIIAVCMTATTAILGLTYTAGAFVYRKWEPINVALKAFIDADKP